MDEVVNGNSQPAARKTLRQQHAQAYSQRLNDACVADNHCPPKGDGQLSYLQQMLKQKGIKVSRQAVRNWLIGESMPRSEIATALANGLGVDEAWLTLGQADHLGFKDTAKRNRARNAMALGATNVVAGLIEMDGGAPAFPDEDDARANSDNIHLYAIIRGANYALHVAAGERDGDMLRFAVPAHVENVTVIGMIRQDFSFDIYELPREVIEEKSSRRAGSVEITVSPDELTQITSFKNRF